MAIRILPEPIANRIAAGEIAESPASVVKELMENSIDAGSGTISVCVKKGGKSLIVISDDGIGMTQEDLELCLERHATSKLPHDDLCDISTLGFRGEALAAISSVSNVVIQSRMANTDFGWLIESRCGEIQPIRPCSRGKGTTIEVRDIFRNVPARQKFLKSDQVENSSIRDVVSALALGHPSIKFELFLNDKKILSWKTNDAKIKT